MRKTKAKLMLAVLVMAFFWRAPFCKAEEFKKTRLPIGVKTSIDKKRIGIGDKIKYRVTISAAKDIEVAVPDLGKDIVNFTIKDFASEKKTFFGQQRLTQWYVLDTYTTGALIIPKAVIRYRRKGEKEWSRLEAEGHAVEVKSALDSRQGSLGHMDIMDIEDPVALPSKKKRLLLIFLSISCLGIILARIYILRKSRTSSLIPQTPAYETACAQLEALERKDYINQGKVKEYYSEVSDIIRRYLENGFKLKAPEMTSEEFLLRAGDSAQLQSAHKALLREFLTACDLVKFAKYVPAFEEITSVFESAKRFVEQTKVSGIEKSPFHPPLQKGCGYRKPHHGHLARGKEGEWMERVSSDVFP